jgi:hypothetical protein
MPGLASLRGGMMEFLLLLGLSFALSVPACYVARRRNTWIGWDYATLFAPIPFWIMLVIVRIGPLSLSNVIEVLLVAFFVPVALTFRVFLVDRFSNDLWRTSMLTCLVCLVIPLGLRLAMPLLPE